MGENRVGRWVREVFRWEQDLRKETVEDMWSLAWDAFLGKYSEANLAKWKELEGYDWRSKVFIRAARRKTLSAVAQHNDIQLQAGQFPYNITPSAIPEGYPGLYLPPAIAEQRCGYMKNAIDDMLNLGKYDRTIMASNLERAIYGMSVHKCPVIRTRKTIEYQLQMPRIAQMFAGLGPDVLMRFMMQFGRYSQVQNQVEMAIPEHINLWDYFWDMEAPDHQTGVANIHRVMMDRGMVRRLAEQPGYDSDAIDRLLSQTSGERSTNPRQNEAPDKTLLSSRYRNIEVVELWGRCPRKELGKDHESVIVEADHDGREIEIRVVMAYANGVEGDGIEIAPAMANRLPLTTRPFNVAYWESFPHSTHGIGVPENMQDSQMMQNGAWRAFCDNKALSGNLLLFYKSAGFKPNQDMNVSPGAKYEVEDWVQDVRQVYNWIAPPDIGQGLLEMLNVAERLSDEESGHPKLMQGEVARHSPKTAFETDQLLEAANKTMGQVIKNGDEGQIEPDIEAIYHYLMATDAREFIKGDYKAQATGFAAYNDKVKRGSAIFQRLQFALSNAITGAYIKVPEHLHELYKSADLDPDQFLKTQEEVDQQRAMDMAMAAQLQAPPGALPLPAPQGEMPGAQGPAPEGMMPQ